MIGLSKMNLSPDLSLSDVRQLILEHESMDDVLGLVRLGRQVQVRFVWVNDEEEFPDETRWGLFHELTCVDRAKIVIDDLGGGLRIGSPELVS